MSAAYCWTVAVRSGLIPDDADPSPTDLADIGLWERLVLADPSDHDIDLKRATWGICCRRLAELLMAAGSADPRQGTVAASWAQLASAIRATGRKSNALSAIAKPAKAEELRPCEITPTWAAGRIVAASTIHRKSQIRQACLLLDAVRVEGTVAAHLLPAIPTGIIRLPRVRKVPAEVPPKPVPSPTEQTWIDLFVALRRVGVREDDLHPLYALRTDAIAQGLGSRDVDRARIVVWHAQGDHRRAAALAMAARLLDRVRGFPDLADLLPAPPIGKLTDRRRSAPALPAGIADELARVLAAQGAALPTQRKAAAAVSALADALAGRLVEPTALIDLLRADRKTLDWSANAGRAAEYDKVLRRLLMVIDPGWTPGWQALQAATVAAGVPMRDNPVPALLSRAEGREPHELDLAWAREIDRSLREAVRYDLARTFAATIARLDALHDIPALAASGLLPPLIGTIRAERVSQPKTRPDGSAPAFGVGGRARSPGRSAARGRG